MVELENYKSRIFEYLVEMNNTYKLLYRQKEQKFEQFQLVVERLRIPNSGSKKSRIRSLRGQPNVQFTAPTKYGYVTLPPRYE